MPDASPPPTVVVPPEVLADALAWAPWRSREGIVTRKMVVARAVAACRAHAVPLEPVPERGLNAILDHLADLAWVRAQYRDDVCSLAGSTDTSNRKMLAREHHTTADELLELTLEWGVPVLVATWHARRLAWDVAKEALDAAPPPLASAWRELFRDSASAKGGFARADVTAAAIGAMQDRASAEAFRAAPPLQELSRVAHAYRADYLEHEFLPRLAVPSDRAAVQRVISVARTAAGDVREPLLRPRGRSLAGPAPREAQLGLWVADRAAELEELTKYGALYARSQGLSVIEAEEVVERASVRLRGSGGATTLSGEWWKILLDELRPYRRRPISAERIEDELWESPETVQADDAAIARSEELRDRMYAQLAQMEGDPLAREAAEVWLRSAEEVLEDTAQRPTRRKVMLRARQKVSEHLVARGVPDEQVDQVLRTARLTLGTLYAAAQREDDPAPAGRPDQDLWAVDDAGRP
ncbi:hypothetical protein Cfla_3514 [Cellulomonas flavigena DSM 20109]|uniref:Uncharacterized protein n=1 Tax=Cellulomonas flavigena (strain ATCC 482 / DSM 20109 / BCRC 11376 / JCM 18109 / NBRC 3775 / NCIMB 8073 / NRS 134) TaxID=446466 RepID=D5UDD0_CELFN|nr:hypothetical protein [Cellulomonas flavigena]ADG76386.1 hypothetical protein Cfla_3514 [Cellulomonas flavigena DSM 20109]